MDVSRHQRSVNHRGDNLIDPVDLALLFPFHVRKTLRFAPPAQIAEEWHRIKETPALAKAGYRACELLTQLRLNDSAIDTLIASRLVEDEAVLHKNDSFRELGSWPADAQLGFS